MTAWQKRPKDTHIHTHKYKLGALYCHTISKEHVWKVSNQPETHERCRVVKGSGLGPLLFSIYMPSLCQLIYHHYVNDHFYADDTQLHMPINSTDPSSLASLTAFLSGIKCWMIQNVLKFNKKKKQSSFCLICILLFLVLAIFHIINHQMCSTSKSNVWFCS